MNIKFVFIDGVLGKIIDPDCVREIAQSLWETDKKVGFPEKDKNEYWFQAEEIFRNSGFITVTDNEWRLYRNQFVCLSCGRIIYYKNDQTAVIEDLYHKMFPHHRRVPRVPILTISPAK